MSSSVPETMAPSVSAKDDAKYQGTAPGLGDGEFEGDIDAEGDVDGD